MIEVEGEDVEASNSQLPPRHIDILGDSGLQGHVSPPSLHRDHGNGNGIVNMANGATAKMCQKDHCTIADEVCNDFFC